MYICRMTINDVKIGFQQNLATLYEPKEIQSIFELIAENLGFSTTTLILNRGEEISEQQKLYFDACLRRLEKSEPVQYVRGKSDFYGGEFLVNQSVLIPRLETEELVDWVIKENQNCSGKILDMGTGSGCIAISIAKNLKNAHVTAIDISEKALDVAQKNATLNQATVDFYQANILREEELAKFSDLEIIVSNPPYVCNSEKKDMRSNVLNYEPHLALFVEDEEPLIFYNAIARHAATNLKNGGKLYCEINESFGNKVAHLFESYGLTNCEIKRDLFGKDRFVKATKL